MKKAIALLSASAFGALLTLSISSAHALDRSHQAAANNGPCQGGVADAAALDGFVLVFETTAAFNPQSASAAAAAAAPGDRRTVIVDGIVMELPEDVIKHQIAIGVFIVVYAGTTIPVEPHEIPCWANPNCPG